MRLPLLALALSLSCTLEPAQDAPATEARSSPADLLTDLRDDGSLIAGLQDRSPEVRWVAARGLARLAEAEQIPVIAARIAHEPDESVLVELVFALGQRGQLDAAAAVPPLVALLRHATPAIRAAAAEALGRVVDDRVTADLVALLSDENPMVRRASALALFRLDGRRYEHARTATPEVLDARDRALSNASLQDGDAEVRWRATYTLAGVKGRDDIARALPAALGGKEPLTRLFALRGLRALEVDGLIDLSTIDVRRLLDDPDELVVIEAVRAQSRSGSVTRLAGTLATHPSALVRLTAAESLRERLRRPDIDDAMRAQWCETLQSFAMDEPSPMVRREGVALLIAVAPPDHALFNLYWLAGSADRRDRERAAKELAERKPALDAAPLLDRLLHDEPAVAAAALAAPASPEARRARLVEALCATDAALVSAAAEESMKPEPSGADGAADATPTAAPPTDPALVAALQSAHERAVGPEMKEARAALRKALGLLPDTAPPAGDAEGVTADPLLERLLAEHRAARADPSPKVRLLTSKGLILLELDRVNAPRHVASFLELAADGFYDGLDFHRLVPNFVVQGLDPRGDGYGTGERRLPDEFSTRHYLAGTLGMPNAGEPHTGGCQIFLTHIPTPHLDGKYTIFGNLAEGMDVLQQLEIGDTVTYVRLAPPNPNMGIPLP